MTIFFESYSLIQTLFLFNYIRRAKIIYFHKRSFPPSNHNLYIKTSVERLILYFNKNIKIETLPVEKINEYNWPMNKMAIELVEELTPTITRSYIYRTMFKILMDENIIKCYKAYLVNDISSRCLFFKLAKDLSASCSLLQIIPASTDNSFIQNKLPVGEELNAHIPGSLCLINKVKDVVNKFKILITLLLLPSGYVILKLRKITLKRNDTKKYDIAMPIIWGFYDNKGEIDGVSRPHNDGYLYNHQIKPGQVIHIFNFWRYSEEIEKKYKMTMDRQGISYIDIKDYKMSPKMILIATKIQWQIILSFLVNFFYLDEKNDYLTYSPAIIYHILNTYFELENINYDVDFNRMDYSPIHIIKTIICNRTGKKTIGIQHVAYPYDLPQLCYVHFDNYIVYGDDFIKGFSPYWDKMKLEKIGRESLDFIANIVNDKTKIEELKDRLRNIYPVRKFMAVIALCSDVPWIPEKRWDELYQALISLKTLNIDFNLFLRFRESSTGYINNFKEIAKQDERIIIDHVTFTTYELMALCDLFIACNTSFTINEALATKAKVFTIDLHGRTKYVFSDYGSDFILNNKDDIIRTFGGLENDFRNFGCKWDLLRKRSNFYYDGKNHERIREAVLKILNETKQA